MQLAGPLVQRWPTSERRIASLSISAEDINEAACSPTSVSSSIATWQSAEQFSRLVQFFASHRSVKSTRSFIIKAKVTIITFLNYGLNVSFHVIPHAEFHNFKSDFKILTGSVKS